MKKHCLFRSLLLVTAFGVLTGCRPEADAPPEDRSVSGGDLQEEAAEAASTTREYLSQSREAVVAATQEQLRQMDARIDQLARRSSDYSAEARARTEDAVAKLREQRNEVAEELEKLRAASNETWREIKAGLDDAWAEMQKTYNEVKNKVAE